MKHASFGFPEGEASPFGAHLIGDLNLQDYKGGFANG